MSKRSSWKGGFPPAWVGRARAEQGGGVAVEAALILPVLIIVLLGFVQFGMAFFLQNNMANAAREAARRLAVGSVTVAGPGTTAQQVVDEYLAGWGGMTFTVTACDPDNPGPNCPVGGDIVVVEIVCRTDDALIFAHVLSLHGVPHVVDRQQDSARLDAAGLHDAIFEADEIAGHFDAPGVVIDQGDHQAAKDAGRDDLLGRTVEDLVEVERRQAHLGDLVQGGH